MPVLWAIGGLLLLGGGGILAAGEGVNAAGQGVNNTGNGLIKAAIAGAVIWYGVKHVRKVF